MLRSLYLRGLDGMKRAEAISKLEMPLGDEEPDDGVWSPDEMGSDFMSAMSKTDY